MLRINNFIVRKDLSNNELFNLISEKFNIKKSDVINWYISKKSIDARKKDDVHYNYCIDIEVKNENKYPKLTHIKNVDNLNINININKKLKNAPIIIGAGPARTILCFNLN